MISKLEKQLIQLQSDGEHKASSMGIDKQCVDTKHQTWPGTARVSLGASDQIGCEVAAPQPPALPPIVNAYSADGTHKMSHIHKTKSLHQENHRQGETRERLRGAQEMERDAEDLRFYSEHLKRHVAADTNRALEQVNEEMRKRTGATRAMIK